MARILILGNGSAGKRWAQTLQHHKIITSDIQGDVNHLLSEDITPTLRHVKPDGVVIASPPDVHLAQLKQCLNFGVKAILCEKPLCGLEYNQRERLTELRQMDTSRVVVAYNYLYHPAIIAAKKFFEENKGEYNTVGCISIQARERWPEWGFILDHLSHTYSILEFITDGVITPLHYNVTQTNDHYHGYVWGVGAATDFNIQEIVNKTATMKKVALVGVNKMWFEIDYSDRMFQQTAAEFEMVLGGGNVDRLTFEMAVRVQEAIWMTLTTRKEAIRA